MDNKTTDLDYKKEFEDLLKDFRQLQKENELLRNIVAGLGVIVGGYPCK